MTLILFGLDGASKEQLLDTMRRRKLPHFSRLLSEGMVSEMPSVYPYVTAPAWASIFSGVNPASHGIFDNAVHRSKDGLRIPNMRNSDAIFLWEYLTWAGKGIMFSGIPFTYPAPRVSGYFITGRFVPKLSYYPDSLGKDIDLSGFDYARQNLVADKFRIQGRLSELLASRLGNLRKRMKASLALMSIKQWDAVAMIESTPDEIFHSSYSETGARDQTFEVLDEWVGEVIKGMKSTDRLLIISDHGFGSFKRVLFVNEWLSSMGYLEIRNSTASQLLRKLGVTADLFSRPGPPGSLARQIARTFPRLTERSRRRVRRAIVVDRRRLDLGRQNVVATGINTPVAYLKLPSAIMADKLGKDLDALLRAGILRKVLKTSSIYRGKYLDEAPGEFLIESDEETVIDTTRMNGGRIFGSPHAWEKGCHKIDGVFVAYPSNRRDPSRQPVLYDMVPTVLNLLGLPIPEDLEGVPLLG